jgi:S-formylglutathione hydrolase FrmB
MYAGGINLSVVKLNILSRTLGMQTNITVILPSFSFADMMNGRNETYYVPGMKYQTLYLLHGGSGDDSDYVNFSNIVRYADEHKLAVVMPADYNAFYSDSVAGTLYWEYVSEELPNICQTMFPLSAKREDNYVAGLSMGGHGAMKMGVMKCEKFSAVLCMSGAAIDPESIQEFNKSLNPETKGSKSMPFPNLEVIFGDLDKFKGSVNDVYHYAKLNVEQKKQLPKFFFTVGDKDFALGNVKQAYEYLTELGYDAHFELVPNYAHEWDFWDLSLRKAIKEWLPIRHTVIYPD